jgi:hypothetical protein
MKLGIIAEEQNDVDVILEISKKILGGRSVSKRSFVGHGCGKLRRKCEVHDLDRKSKAELHQELTSKIKLVGFSRKLVLIPTEELEAWLLSDPQAIQRCFNLSQTPKIRKNPETIASPKEYLRDLVWSLGKKKYVNTIHNVKIAKNIELGKIASCQSFMPLSDFLRTKRLE